MSKKKKVTAPVTYNPGKGRPKEYLAYLNWQEMQELQRINGGNMERGPKGLPSFPPAGAMSGGSAKSPASTSTSKAAGSTSSSKMGASSSQSGGVKSSTASKSTTSGKMGSSSSQTGGVKSATGGGGGSSARPSGGFSQSVFGGGGGGGISRPSTTVSRPSGVNLGGGGAGRDTSRGLGVGAGTTAIGRPASDKSAMNAANRANTQTAQNTPALRSDQSRTIGVGPMGTPVNVRTAAPGSRISGAIKSVQQPVSPTTRGVGVPTATITNPMASQGTSFATPRDAAYSNMLASGRLAAGLPASGSFPSPAQVRAQTEARLNAQRMAQQYSQYRSPPSMATQRLAQQYSQYRSPPSMPPADFTGANSPFADPSVRSYNVSGTTDYPSAPSGVYGPRAGVGVGYLSSGIPVGPTTGMPSPYSGTTPPRFNAESTLRAYEAEKRAPVQAKIQDRVPSEVPTAPRGRVAVPGLIANPSLSRPMTSADAFTQYSWMDNPTATPISQSLPPPKMQDRINVLPSNEQSLYTGIQKAQDRINVLPSNEQSLYTGQFTSPAFTKDQDRINVLPSNEQSLYTGREAGIPALQQRYSDAPPYAFAEKTLGVENLMSDTGIRKSIPGFAPSAPTAADLAAQYSQYRSPPAMPPADFIGANSPFADPAVESYVRDAQRLAPITGPWPGQSAVPPTPSKAFTDPIADRIMGTYPGPISSEVSAIPGGTAVYRTPEGFGVSEPPSFMRESDAPPYAGTQGIADLAPVGPAPGMSRVSNIFATNPRDLSEVLRGMVNESYEGLRPRGEDTALGVPGPETPSTDFVGDFNGEGRITVKRGDTLTKIARENNVTIGDILDANPQISDPNRIREGQKISIPGGDRGEGAGDEATSPSFSQGMTEDQEERVDETLDRVKNFQKVVGPTIGLATGVPVNTVARRLTNAYIDNVKERLNKYAAMTDAEKAVAEARDPALIGWGRVAGIPSVNDYSTYTSWADRSGLRAPQSTGGGGGDDRSSIAALANYEMAIGRGGGGGSNEDRDSTSSVPSGARPYIYYEWDLGLNIPSPSDPKYTDYQKYLSERAAAQSSFGMV